MSFLNFIVTRLSICLISIVVVVIVVVIVVVVVVVVVVSTKKRSLQGKCILKIKTEIRSRFLKGHQHWNCFT